MKFHIHPEVRIRQVTRGARSHFFGYYDKCPWDATGRYLLALETDLTTRPPGPDDEATIGMIDTAEDDAWLPLAQTHAWNWQMGARLHWMPSDPSRKIIYNIREGGRFHSIIHDVFNRETRRLNRPIYDVSADGKTAYSLNFARLACFRPGYGYAGVVDPDVNDPHPDHDGIWRLDLETGESQLIVSYAAMAHFRPEPSMKSVPHWFNHIMISPSGSRLFFLQRWRYMEGDLPSWKTRLITINPDGSEPFILRGLKSVSHYDWRDDTHILLTAHMPGTDHYAHVLITDRSDDKQPIVPDQLQKNGHCTYSPDRQWILTDTYPDEAGYSSLLMLRTHDGTLIEPGRFRSPPEYAGEVRCDLHPRWNRDGTRICIDSACNGSRQLFVLQSLPMLI